MTEPSHARHRRQAKRETPVSVALLTVSDSRTPETDRNGAYLRRAAEAAGHRVVSYELVPDEVASVEAALERFLASAADCLLVNGGTGLSPRDHTYDVLARRLERKLPGFGELFRILSYQEIGAAAMLSRAVAGTVGQKLIVSMPGSHAAVRLAWEKLLAPELAHMIFELKKGPREAGDTLES